MGVSAAAAAAARLATTLRTSLTACDALGRGFSFPQGLILAPGGAGGNRAGEIRPSAPGGFMVLYRVTRDFSAGRAELQTLTPGCSEPGAGTRRSAACELGRHLQTPETAWGCGATRAGTPWWELLLCQIQKEKLLGGLLPLKPHRNAHGHQGLNRHHVCSGTGGCQTVPLCAGLGAGDEGPGTLIPSGLKRKEKEQSLSREAQDQGGAGSVPQLGSAPGTARGAAGSARLSQPCPHPHGE